MLRSLILQRILEKISKNLGVSAKCAQSETIMRNSQTQNERDSTKELAWTKNANDEILSHARLKKSQKIDYYNPTNNLRFYFTKWDIIGTIG